MGKHLMLIHGRNFKPSKEPLEALWFDAILSGLQRDFSDLVPVYKKEEVKKTFIYYGDISNEFLESSDNPYDEEKEIKDIRDRQECLKALKMYRDKAAFLENGESNYKSLQGASGLKEKLATAFVGDFSTFIGLAEPLIRMLAKDVSHYWDPDTAFGSSVRWRLTEPLRKALHEGDDIMLVSHSLGSMIAYDVLWKFSYYGEYSELRKTGNKLSKLITLGSPLGNETVKKNLKGSGANGTRRYPTLIRTWENFSAEDDYISHDETLENDYRKMRLSGMVEIRDHDLYNLALRDGNSNPHHSLGYLIHPKFIEVLAGWLRDPDQAVA